MFKFNNREIRTMSMMSLLLTLVLTLCVLVSLLLTLNIFHILHSMKYAKIQILYWKKRKRSNKFNRFRLQVEVFFLPNMKYSLPHPPLPLIGP